MKRNYRIHCYSEIKSDFVPTLHPPFESVPDARAYGNANIKSTDFIVLPE